MSPKDVDAVETVLSLLIALGALSVAFGFMQALGICALANFMVMSHAINVRRK